MFDSTSQFDEEPEASTKFNIAITNIFGDTQAQILHTGVGNNNVDAGTI